MPGWELEGTLGGDTVDPDEIVEEVLADLEPPVDLTVLFENQLSM